MSGTSNMAASAASRELFADGVRAVLHTWPVLQDRLTHQVLEEVFITEFVSSEEDYSIAVDNGFGGVYGQQKADWMVDVVQQYFHDNADLQQYEVEDYIAQLMDQEFDTVVDDGSLPQVSISLLQMFSQWKQGALQQLQQTINALSMKKNQRAKVTAPVPPSGEDSDDETQEMECQSSSPSVGSTDHPPPPPQDEEDGWTVVRKKR